MKIHNYEDEYADIDEEERFHKISKKKNKNKVINKKAQIRQQRREKDKNREQISKRDTFVFEDEPQETDDIYEDTWE